ncbi:MAG: inositol monophosphatase [Prevotellaceae bacterium]|jgi:myo-inositol-1(or 4)-monophosphatase|nr:inositol monophosphatase [Prevotellaceae bacterium]
MTDNMRFNEICENVCHTARVAGQFMLDERKIFSSDKIETKGVNDFVSYVDKKTEELIVGQLSPLIAGAGFLTEEGTVKQSNNSKYTWIIDPLDGTTNYIHGLSPYAVSIGLTENNIPVLGVVHIASADQCFYAWKDSKAFMNGEEIKPSTVGSIKDSLAITGFPYRLGEKIDNYMNLIRYLTFNSHGVRRLGSAAADLAYIAAGWAEVFYQTDLHPWDVAAGAFIARQAGAIVTDFTGGDNYLFGQSILATGNTTLGNQMVNLLSEYFPEQQ